MYASNNKEPPNIFQIFKLLVVVQNNKYSSPNVDEYLLFCTLFYYFYLVISFTEVCIHRYQTNTIFRRIILFKTSGGNNKHPAVMGIVVFKSDMKFSY